MKQETLNIIYIAIIIIITIFLIYTYIKGNTGISHEYYTSSHSDTEVIVNTTNPPIATPSMLPTNNKLKYYCDKSGPAGAAPLCVATTYGEDTYETAPYNDIDTCKAQCEHSIRPCNPGESCPGDVPCPPSGLCNPNPPKPPVKYPPCNPGTDLCDKCNTSNYDANKWGNAGYGVNDTKVSCGISPDQSHQFRDICSVDACMSKPKGCEINSIYCDTCATNADNYQYATFPAGNPDPTWKSGTTFNGDSPQCVNINEAEKHKDSCNLNTCYPCKCENGIPDQEECFSQSRKKANGYQYDPSVMGGNACASCNEGYKLNTVTKICEPTQPSSKKLNINCKGYCLNSANPPSYIEGFELSSPDECRNKCNANTVCKGFDYNTTQSAGEDNCFLKTQECIDNDPIHSNFINSNVSCPPPKPDPKPPIPKPDECYTSKPCNSKRDCHGYDNYCNDNGCCKF
tara:strand:+ start:1812 stop:3182 length:1371 start_codon:yes stop_codon:yes gene_type:complete